MSLFYSFALSAIWCSINRNSFSWIKTPFRYSKTRSSPKSTCDPCRYAEFMRMKLSERFSSISHGKFNRIYIIYRSFNRMDTCCRRSTSLDCSCTVRRMTFVRWQRQLPTVAAPDSKQCLLWLFAEVVVQSAKIELSHSQQPNYYV